MSDTRPAAPWVRIRQICLVAPQLAPAVQALQDALGLQVAYRDPNVAKYGLENAVLPIGPNQFLEVVAPTRADTAVGRFLARAPSPDSLGAYMLICDCDDPAAARARAQALGIRVVHDYQYPDYHGVQLHPRDTGAVMIEFNATPGGADLSGPYHPAGPDWQRAVRAGCGGIASVRVRAQDPASLAQRWATLFGKPAQAVGQGFVIALDLGQIEIVPLRDSGNSDALRGVGSLSDGPTESLSDIALSATPNLAPLTLCGVRFTA